MQYPKTKAGQGGGLRAALFMLPFLLGAFLLTGTSQPGTAQILGQDPSGVLQQLQRGTTGSSGPLDTGLPLPQPQVLQPQAPAALRPQPRSRLEEILSSRAGVRLEQFGYDQLGVGRQVVIPETGAVADDYIMGPGDEVVVSLRGQENSDVRTMVDRNGRVVLPRLAPIPAAGRPFGSFRADVEAAVRRAYVASNASVAIGRVRQISVLVSGEVRVPGQRIVTGLSSVVDALLLSNGVSKAGSLRNIQLVRNGRTFIVDLYAVLTGSGARGAMRLADGDRIIVPLLGPTVAVAGLVRRPAIYELPAGARGITAQALLALAGGQEVRGRYRISVQRIEPDGQFHLVPLKSDKELIRDSEILRVELGANQAASQMTLSGPSGLAGKYPIVAGTRLSDVIKAPGALGSSPYTLFGIIVRKDPRTLLRSLVAFTPVAVLNGSEDEILQPDDIVRPISVGEARLLSFVVKTYLAKLSLDQARIRNPSVAQSPDRQEANSPAPTGAVTAGAPSSSASGNSANNLAPAVPAAAISPDNPFGLEPGALEEYNTGQDDFISLPADLRRQDVIALLEVAAPGTLLAQQRQLAYQQALSRTMGPLGSQSPQQMAQAQQAAVAAAESEVRPSEFNGANPRANERPESNFSVLQTAPPLAANLQNQQATDPESYATNQEVHTLGELTRQLDVDPLILVNFLLDHRAGLDGAVQGPGSYFIGPNVSLADLVAAAGGTAGWADESGVELVTTVVDASTGRAASQRQTLPLRQGTLASYIIRPRDQLRFNRIFTDTDVGSVTIQGEVRFSGNYPIRRGDHLSDLLIRSGGLTSVAYPEGTVFLRKSAAEVEKQGYNRAADEIESQMIAGVARVGNDKITGDAVAAIQGFVAQLRRQRALGRISIVADPAVLAAHPSLDPLLEAGDVVFIPQRPSTISVLGEVMQPGSYSYQAGTNVEDYIKKAGGYAQFADDDMKFVVLPDGSARRVDTSWLNFDTTTLPPGSSIVVPRDLAPLFPRQVVLDVTSILSSMAVTIASLAVLARQ